MASLTKYTGGARGALLSGLKQVAAAAPQVSEGGVPYLKLNKDSGNWQYGQTDTPVSKGSRWACIITTFATGWISWKGGQVEAEAMASVGEPMVDPSTLPPVTSRNGWEEQVGVAFVCVDSDHDSEIGTVVIYKQNSKGGVEAITRLRSLVTAAVEDQGPEVPIVLFENTSYTHTEWGKVFKPVFTVDEWMTIDELASEYGKALEGVTLTAKKLGNAAPEPRQVEQAPAARRRPAPAPTADVIDITPEPAAPTSRRRPTVVDEIRAAAAAEPEAPPFDADPAPVDETPRRRRRTL